MNNVLLLCVMLGLSGQLAGVEIAALARGGVLHDEDCLMCHSPAYYVRPDRIVTTYPRLIRQVRSCQLDVGVEWDIDQYLDVLEYLNTIYYKFEGVGFLNRSYSPDTAIPSVPPLRQ